MKKIILQHLFSLFLLFSILSCGEDGPTKSREFAKDEIFPLNSENEWIVRISNPDSLLQFGIDTNYIIKDTLIGNEKWYKSVTTHVFGYDERFLRNTDEGLTEYDIYANTSSLRLKYPAQTNETYQHFGGTIKVISTNDTITVPAGTFICYHYQSTFFDSWYCPNVGLVREEEYYLNPRTMIGITELLNYQIK